MYVICASLAGSHRLPMPCLLLCSDQAQLHARADVGGDSGPHVGRSARRQAAAGAQSQARDHQRKTVGFASVAFAACSPVFVRCSALTAEQKREKNKKKNKEVSQRLICATVDALAVATMMLQPADWLIARSR